MPSGDAMQRFFEIFRASTHRMMELSFGEEAESFGVLTGGDATLPPLVFRYAKEVGLDASWACGADRFVASFPAIRYLCRTDWRHSQLQALTLYVRLPDDVERSDFEAALDRGAPLRWPGRSPFEASEAIGLRAPHGIATRMDIAGRQSTNVYWYINRSAYLTHRSVLRPLARFLGWPLARYDEMALAVQRASAIEGLAVLGIDGPAELVRTTVKLDLPNVSLDRAAPLLRERGVSADRLRSLARTARDLGVTTMSYLGLKVAEAGWNGWRGYFACQPWLRRSATVGRLSVPGADRPRPPSSLGAPVFTPLSFD